MAATPSALTCTAQLVLKTIEELGTTNVPAGATTGRRITHDQFNQLQTLSLTSTPDVNEVCYFIATLSGGALTIDLTSLTGSNGRSIDLTGDKIRRFALINPAANAVTVSKGASNGYTGFGSSFSAVAGPYLGDLFGWIDIMVPQGTAVSSSVKTIDLAGSGSDAFYVCVWSGD